MIKTSDLLLSHICGLLLMLFYILYLLCIHHYLSLHSANLFAHTLMQLDLSGIVDNDLTKLHRVPNV